MIFLKPVLNLFLSCNLFVGYNYKYTTEIKPLINCINDANGYSQYFNLYRGQKITDDRFTNAFFKHRLGKSYFKMRFKQLLENDSNDVKVLTFSGHGYRDVSNNKESIIFPSNEEMSDKEFEELIKSFKSEFKLVCIFDSCHSGSMLNLPYVYEVKLNHFILKYRRNYVEYNKGFIIQLASCQDTKTSFEIPRLYSHGLFTEFLLQFLNDNNGDVTYEQVMKYLHSKMLFFRQFPVLSSSKPLDLSKKFMTF